MTRRTSGPSGRHSSPRRHLSQSEAAWKAQDRVCDELGITWADWVRAKLSLPLWAVFFRKESGEPALLGSYADFDDACEAISDTVKMAPHYFQDPVGVAWLVRTDGAELSAAQKRKLAKAKAGEHPNWLDSLG